MDKKFLGLMMIFFLSFGLFVIQIVFRSNLSSFTRASEDLVASNEKSILFVWPLSTNTGASSQVEVNVFVRNENNIPLPNKKVNLQTTLGMVKENDVVTDKSGKSTFNIDATTPGIAEVSATVDGTIQIKQKVTVKFN